jgi:hypothetical protein
MVLLKVGIDMGQCDILFNLYFCRNNNNNNNNNNKKGQEI